MPGLRKDIREQQIILGFVEGLLPHARYQMGLQQQVTFQGTIVRTRELMLLNDRQQQRGGRKFVSVSAACADKETSVIEDLKENEMEKGLSTAGVSVTSDNKLSGSGQLSLTQDVYHTSAGRGIR